MSIESIKQNLASVKQCFAKPETKRALKITGIAIAAILAVAAVIALAAVIVAVPGVGIAVGVIASTTIVGVGLVCIAINVRKLVIALFG